MAGNDYWTHLDLSNDLHLTSIVIERNAFINSLTFLLGQADDEQRKKVLQIMISTIQGTPEGGWAKAAAFAVAKSTVQANLTRFVEQAPHVPAGVRATPTRPRRLYPSHPGDKRRRDWK